MLEPIGDGNLDHALALLHRGFPEHSEAFWRGALERAQTFTEAATGWPIGYLMRAKERAAGVILTFSSLRVAPSGERRTFVNLSSWYVEPEARLAAVPMLKEVVSLGEDLLTDLSPSPSVVRMLPMLGFSPWNEGFLAIPASAALSGTVGDTAVAPVEDIPADALDEDERRILADHDRLGCLCAGLFDGERWHALAFLPTRIKGMRAAYLVYARDRRLAIGHRAALARFLAKRAMPVFCLDADGNDRPSGALFFRRRLKFYRGSWSPLFTDYAYSELIYLRPE